MSCHYSAAAGRASPVAPVWTTHWCPGGPSGAQEGHRGLFHVKCTVEGGVLAIYDQD
jgi:hypothetical protein